MMMCVIKHPMCRVLLLIVDSMLTDVKQTLKTLCDQNRLPIGNTHKPRLKAVRDGSEISLSFNITLCTRRLEKQPGYSYEIQDEN